jgi:hypothetical protein
MNNPVRALAVSGANVYAGGYFTNAGGINANYIARWDGNSWNALGSGMSPNSLVMALAMSGTNLYAGGVFTNAGGISANYIAKWDGSSWSALGSGMDNYVDALAVSGSDLYAGGVFRMAGGKVSVYAAQAYLELRPTLSMSYSGGDLGICWPTIYDTVTLQANPDPANANTWTNANYPFTTNGATKCATVPLAYTNLFFRLIGY